MDPLALLELDEHRPEPAGAPVDVERLARLLERAADARVAGRRGGAGAVAGRGLDWKAGASIGERVRCRIVARRGRGSPTTVAQPNRASRSMETLNQRPSVQVSKCPLDLEYCSLLNPQSQALHQLPSCLAP